MVDETFLGLGFVPDATPAAMFDPAVITIGSLSKSVWGGLRIGWIRAPAELVQRLAALRTSIDLSGPVLDQLLAVELIGQLDAILLARVEELTRKRNALQRQLAASLPEWKANEPDGGISLWIDLGTPVSTALTLLARSVGVMIVPGSRFGVDGTFERYLRLPYAHQPELLADAVRRLAEVLARARSQWRRHEPPGDRLAPRSAAPGSVVDELLVRLVTDLVGQTRHQSDKIGVLLRLPAIEQPLERRPALCDNLSAASRPRSVSS